MGQPREDEVGFEVDFRHTRCTFSPKAAPVQTRGTRRRGYHPEKGEGPAVTSGAFVIRRLPTLPRSHPRSTIGSRGLNFRVRDGNGCDPSDTVTENRDVNRRRGAQTEEWKQIRARDVTGRCADRQKRFGKPWDY